MLAGRRAACWATAQRFHNERSWKPAQRREGPRAHPRPCTTEHSATDTQTHACVGSTCYPGRSPPGSVAGAARGAVKATQHSPTAPPLPHAGCPRVPHPGSPPSLSVWRTQTSVHMSQGAPSLRYLGAASPGKHALQISAKVILVGAWGGRASGPASPSSSFPPSFASSSCMKQSVPLHAHSARTRAVSSSPRRSKAPNRHAPWGNFYQSRAGPAAMVRDLPLCPGRPPCAPTAC
jgi:hypothetical protein